MKPFLAIIFSFLFSTSIYAQQENYIVNGGFEELDSCMQALNKNIKGWEFTGSLINIRSRCFNDNKKHILAFNLSSLGVPFSYNYLLDYQEPNTGDCFARISFLIDGDVYYTNGEQNASYAMAKLIKPLTIGNTYQLKFYVNLDVWAIYQYQYYYGYNKIGALLSTYKPTDTSIFIANKKPQYESEFILKDTLNWIEINKTLYADSAYEYLTIGRFAKLSAIDTSYRLFSNIIPSWPKMKDMSLNIDDVSLVESPVSKLIFPSAFSPNNDGLNDSFGALYAEYLTYIKNFDLKIFNRLGQEVFHSTDITNYWDGKYKNKLESIGTYVYVYTYTDFNGIHQNGKGSFMLIE